MTKQISLEEFASVLQQLRALEWESMLEVNTFYQMDLIDVPVEFLLGDRLYAASFQYDEISKAVELGYLGDYELTAQDLLLEQMTQYSPWDDPVFADMVEYQGASIKLTIEIDIQPRKPVWEPKPGVPMVVHPWPLERPSAEFNMFSALEWQSIPGHNNPRCLGGVNRLTGTEAEKFRALREDMLLNGPYSNQTPYMLVKDGDLEMVVLFRETFPFEGEYGVSFYSEPNTGCE